MMLRFPQLATLAFVLRAHKGIERPRAHHLRHAFAVRTLLRWYRRGEDPQRNLLRLSTFLGHVDPSKTARYITLSAELFDLASDCFQKFAKLTWPADLGAGA